MITLYNFGPMWGLPDPSPFVIKTEVQLMLSGVAFRTEHAGLGQAPKGKLPFISDDGEIIADSVFIREHLQQRHGVDLDTGLNAVERAQAWAMERLCEDHLYWAIVSARWADDTNFANGPIQFFAGAPDEVVTAARAGMMQTLHCQGFGRHAPQDVGRLARRSFEALSVQLGDKAYMFGETATALDATAFGVIAGALVPCFKSPVRDAVEAFPNLVAYRDRLMVRFYPGFTTG